MVKGREGEPEKSAQVELGTVLTLGLVGRAK